MLITTSVDWRLKVWSYNDSKKESLPLFDMALDGVVHLKSGKGARRMVTVEYPGSHDGAGILGKTMRVCVWDLDKVERFGGT